MTDDDGINYPDDRMTEVAFLTELLKRRKAKSKKWKKRSFEYRDANTDLKIQLDRREATIRHLREVLIQFENKLDPAGAPARAQAREMARHINQTTDAAILSGSGVSATPCGLAETSEPALKTGEIIRYPDGSTSEAPPRSIYPFISEKMTRGEIFDKFGVNRPNDLCPGCDQFMTWCSVCKALYCLTAECPEHEEECCGHLTLR